MHLRHALSSPLFVAASAAAMLGCHSRPAPSVRPDPAPSVTAPTLQAIGPETRAPSSPPGFVPLNLCAMSEPEVDRSAALGVRPRAVTQNGRTEYNYTASTVFLRAQGTPLPPSSSSGALELVLSAPSVVRRDQPIALRVSFRNRSARSLTVIRSNDGSFEHAREPFVDVYAEDLATRAVYRSSFVGGRCGMVNQLAATDLVPIAGRASSDAPASEWARNLTESKIPAAGRYRVWVVYRMCSFAEAQGMGTSTVTAPSDLFVGRASSNAIELTVR